MPLVYAAADLMVTRAGAGTIAELATVGDAGGRSCRGRARPRTTRSTTPASSATTARAVLVEEAELTVDRLVGEIDALHRRSRAAGGDVAAGRATVGARASQRRARRPHRTGGGTVST